MCALRLVSRTVKRVHVHSVTVAIAKLTTLWQDEKGYIVVDDDDDDAVTYYYYHHRHHRHHYVMRTWRAQR